MAATQHQTALFTDCDQATAISHKLHIQLGVILTLFERCPLLDEEILAASQTLSANQKILEKLSTA